VIQAARSDRAGCLPHKRRIQSRGRHAAADLTYSVLANGSAALWRHRFGFEISVDRAAITERIAQALTRSRFVQITGENLYGKIRSLRSIRKRRTQRIRLHPVRKTYRRKRLSVAVRISWPRGQRKNCYRDWRRRKSTLFIDGIDRSCRGRRNKSSVTF